MFNAWFLSDIHLNHINERSSIVLLRFLSDLLQKKKPCTHLILLGDIFDFWAGSSNAFYEKYQPIVDAITEVRRSGIEVHYFEGNHDMHLQEFWTIRGIQTWDEFKVFQFDNQKIRVEHGDLINPDDHAYLTLRKVLRSDSMKSFVKIANGNILLKIAETASITSRKFSQKKRTRDQSNIIQMIRDHAARAYDESSFDLIVTGHMHVSDDFKTDFYRSINLGSWFEGPKAFWCSNSQGTLIHL